VDEVFKVLRPSWNKPKRASRCLRCLGHVINLAAKAFLYGEDYDAFEQDINNMRERSEILKELTAWRKRGPVGRLHNIIIFICRSPQRRQAFAELINPQEKSEFDYLNLLIDNATRWNSLYLMIQRAVKLRDRIDLFCYQNQEAMHGPRRDQRPQNEEDEAHLLSKDHLKAEDWETLKEIMHILKDFEKLTRWAEGAQIQGDRGVLSNYLTIINELLHHMKAIRDDLALRAADEELNSSSITYLTTCSNNAWFALDKWFTKLDETPAVYASVLTNPTMKFKWFEHHWQPTKWDKTQAEMREWLRTAKQAIRRVWDEDYVDLELSPGQEAVVPAVRPRSPTAYERSVNLVELYGNNDTFEDQLEAWMKKPVFNLEPRETLPKYWLSQRCQKDKFRIAQLGLDMIAIPAMSSHCERVFSQAKLLITGQRMRLQADIIEATQCLRAWEIEDRKKAGIWKGKGNWIPPESISAITDEPDLTYTFPGAQEG
jgi:hypothetical protein